MAGEMSGRRTDADGRIRKLEGTDKRIERKETKEPHRWSKTDNELGTTLENKISKSTTT